MTDRYIRRIAPFRHPRIYAYLRLPVAFRSLSRLSSALSAKASTLCSFLLDLLSFSLKLRLLELYVKAYFALVTACLLRRYACEVPASHIALQLTAILFSIVVFPFSEIDS